MVRTPWMSWLWPGLPPLWRRGSWSGLGMAVGLACGVNFMLVATFGWTEWISPTARSFGWLCVGGAWLGGLAVSARQMRAQVSQTEAESGEDLFQLAQGEYLKGNWYEAELALNRLLRRNGHDLEARLMLASLLRRTERIAEAGDQLRRIERCDGSEKWQLEINSEWSWLNEKAQDATEAETEEETDEIELTEVTEESSDENTPAEATQDLADAA